MSCSYSNTEKHYINLHQLQSENKGVILTPV